MTPIVLSNGSYWSSACPSQPSGDANEMKWLYQFPARTQVCPHNRVAAELQQMFVPALEGRPDVCSELFQWEENHKADYRTSMDQLDTIILRGEKHIETILCLA